MVARAGVDWCSYCDVYPRHPCQDQAEAVECPNCHPEMKELYRRSLPGYSRDDADELAEYRRRYGPIVSADKEAEIEPASDTAGEDGECHYG